jgi:glutamate dehydrogenase
MPLDYSNNEECFFALADLFFSEIFREERKVPREALFYSLFCLKFSPEMKNYEEFEEKKGALPEECRLFLDSLEKTNFFLPEKKALGFRFNGNIINLNRPLYPGKPYAVFFIAAKECFGFHVRFQDIARGGFRTVIAEQQKGEKSRKGGLFFECYLLAWTQEKKNIDIPEGGSKAILFVEGKKNILEAQEEFIETLLCLVHDPSGKLLDYYGRPELLFLGPDEHLGDEAIKWMAEYSKSIGYPLREAFISGKKTFGIHHKHYGVTSFGLFWSLEKALESLGISKGASFSVKMTGGPDGDVAGNTIVNFQKHKEKECHLLAILDVSGLLYDPDGLDLSVLCELFKKGQNASFYPLVQLHKGGFFRPRVQNTKEVQSLEKFFHSLPTDVFIPAGGPPYALTTKNCAQFFDDEGNPSSRLIVEGANAYLTQQARDLLEDMGTLIIKDIVANKGGVIASSYEVLLELLLSEEEFTQNKEEIVREVLEKVEKYSKEEVDFLLHLHQATGKNCSDLADKLSSLLHKIGKEEHKRLEKMALTADEKLEVRDWLPKLISSRFPDREEKMEESYKKAILATIRAKAHVYNLAPEEFIRQCSSQID